MQQSPLTQPQRQVEPIPEAREVAPNAWKITVPIPFPLRTVNVHALVGNDAEWTLIDAGMGTPEARAAFTAGVQRAGLSILRQFTEWVWELIADLSLHDLRHDFAPRVEAQREVVAPDHPMSRAISPCPQKPVPL